MCVCVCVCVCVWNEILKNKIIQAEVFNMKEGRRYNVSVSINNHQNRCNQVPLDH